MSNDERSDIIQLLQEDHREVERLLAEFDTVSLAGRNELFWTLTHDVVRHEVAEEVVVYPAARDLPGGSALADARVEEQAEAEQRLAKMEKLDAESEEFARQVITLRSAVLTHAKAEETSVFVLLRDNLPAEQRFELGARYKRAKEAAPTRPHPHAPDGPPGNVVMGPVAALVDKVRDAASAA
ncbi:MAG: hemerythrin domain-containing protein [Acidimicrobiales bacterium]